MARWLILDSEAVYQLTRPRSRQSAIRIHDLAHRFARNAGANYVIPTGVLAEVYQGHKSDAAIDFVARAAQVVDLDRRIARMAGRLRAKAKVGSVVDATVAATAVLRGDCLIATGDPDDLRALTCDHSRIDIWALNEPE